MATPFDTFRAKLGIGTPQLKGVGYGYTPTILQQGQTRDQLGQSFLDKLGQRKDTGQTLYGNLKQQQTNRVASDLVNRSAGLKFDEFGKPQLNLADFGSAGQSRLKGISQHGDLATQIAQNRQAYSNAVTMQNLNQYGLGGSVSISGTAVPGATSGNAGARAVAMATQVMKNGTPYVWGGNSLSTGIDCSGLVQQIYRKLGVNLPRTTYEQAKSGRRVSVAEIRPGDLVFYGGDFHHVGIYAGGGHVIHAANSRLGVITSNLNNSNGAPTLVIRPY